MIQRIFRTPALSAAGVLALTTVAVLFAVASASAAEPPTVYIKGGAKSLHFEAPATIVAGESLRVVNTTNPHKVGPHTFSLVEESLIPKTAKDRHLCNTKGHICRSIAEWHGVKGNGPVTHNPAKAGAPGWDTLGDLSTKGDSWFTGEKPGSSITQSVSADTSAGPTKIYFMCAIHPWMHGSIEVLPGG